MITILELLFGPDGALTEQRAGLSQSGVLLDYLFLALLLLVGGGILAVLGWMAFFRGTVKPLSPAVRAALEDQPLPPHSIEHGRDDA